MPTASKKRKRSGSSPPPFALPPTPESNVSRHCTRPASRGSSVSAPRLLTSARLEKLLEPPRYAPHDLYTAHIHKLAEPPTEAALAGRAKAHRVLQYDRPLQSRKAGEENRVRRNAARMTVTRSAAAENRSLTEQAAVMSKHTSPPTKTQLRSPSFGDGNLQFGTKAHQGDGLLDRWVQWERRRPQRGPRKDEAGSK